MHSKQINSVILIFVMMFSLVFSSNIVFAAEGSVYVSNYTANGGRDIEKGKSFTLKVTIKNDSSDDITNVSVSTAGNSSFTQITAGNVDKIVKNTEGIAELKLFYTGGVDTYLTLTVSYKDGADKDENFTYTAEIDNIVPDDSGSGGGGTVIDKGDFKPVLEITSESIPEGKGGGSITIPLTISNIAKYEAREIKVTPALPENVFIVDQMTVYKVIDKISAGKSANISFKFKIDKSAKAGTYKVPLEIKYKNVYGVDFTDSEEIYIKITNDNLPPQLVVKEAKTNPKTVTPGENFTLTFDLWNMGTIEAKNVTIDIDSGSNFFVMDNVTKKYLFELKGLNNNEITYNLRAKDDLESGTYPVTVILGHEDEGGIKYPIYISVKGEKEKENVNIITENISAPQQAVSTEQPFTVAFDVKNTGSTDAKDVKITVESGDKILPQSLNVLTIDTLKPGETTPVSFTFVATKDCESRSYPIKAVIEYKNGDEQVKKEQYMGVLVDSDKESTTLNTIPKIIISEYSSEPGMVKAGENFTLNMTFLNTSKLKAVQNMKITLVVDEKSEETGGSVFTPVQSSNTFYIDKLDPGETSKKTMTMYTIPDAKAKTYVVKAVFEYEYEENGQLKTNNMEDVFGIAVIQPARLEVTEAIVSEPAIVGEPVYISSEFYNTGKVKLSNLMVKIEGDFDTRESNYFVGNFDIGSGDYYEGSIIPLKPGETTGKIVYTFEDAAGEEHRIETEFTVNAMEAAETVNPFPEDFYPGDMGTDMAGQNTSKFPIVWVIAGGVVVLAGVVVLIVVLKKRKKKKELMLDEDI